MEEWKFIEGYNGRYSISNQGRVRNNESGKVVGNYDRGYVWLSVSGKGKELSIAKLFRKYWANNFSGEWKVIEGYGGRYSISNEGMVKNNESFISMKLGVASNGYSYYSFVDNKKVTSVSKSTLMRKYWEFEWIKELRDGEEAKRCLFDDRYFVTNQGRVWSNARKMGWMNAARETHRDTYYYAVSIGGKGIRVHRLVGMHFLPDFSPDLDVCHYNEELPVDKINCVENLFMGTESVNISDSHIKGRSYHSIPVDEVREMREKHKSGMKIIDISREYDRSYSVVSQMLSGNTYQWVS